jgi:hypothetical protein
MNLNITNVKVPLFNIPRPFGLNHRAISYRTPRKPRGALQPDSQLRSRGTLYLIPLPLVLIIPLALVLVIVLIVPLPYLLLLLHPLVLLLAMGL